jgi:hypothetical protein
MKTYKKNYIGKGIQVPNMQIVKVTIKVEEFLKFKHEFEGNEYITFEVAKMQKADNYNRTHTVYVTTREEVSEKENKEA